MARGSLLDVEGALSVDENGWGFDAAAYGNCIASWIPAGYDRCLKTDLTIPGATDRIAYVLSDIPTVDSLVQLTSGNQPARGYGYIHKEVWPSGHLSSRPDYYTMPSGIFRNRGAFSIFAVMGLRTALYLTDMTLFAAYDDSGNVVFRLGKQATTNNWVVSGRDANGNTYSLVSASGFTTDSYQTVVITVDLLNGVLNMQEKLDGAIFEDEDIGTDSATPAGAPNPDNIVGALTAAGSEAIRGNFYALAVYDEVLSSETITEVMGAVDFYFLEG